MQRSIRGGIAVISFLAFGALLATNAAATPTLTNVLTISADSTDLTPVNGGGGGVNVNRLGGFGSDLYYDRYHDVYYGLVDRGPGGGTIGYDTRVQQFKLNVDATTGAISGFALQSTINFKQADGTPFTGFLPNLDPANGSKANVGRSFDPEGLAVAPNGNFYVSDEYGPAVKEFKADGTLVRTFATPANLIPKQADNTTNFSDGRPTIVTGRQDNRGFEGLAITPDGKKLFAMLQDPLVNEGSSNDGRRSQNLRIVEYDAVTGQPARQFIYQLESLADINARVPGQPFSATAQGRNIGISSITALNDHQFLVIERDNGGVGVEDPTGATAVASKRVYIIDINGASDVSNVSLAGTNTLPAGVVPVSKTLYLDIQAALAAAGIKPGEKIEGLTIGPQLADGSFLILIGTDNDFSVTQNASGTQFDVCSGGTQVALGDPCPAGETLLNSFLYAFHDVDLTTDNYTVPTFVPEPTTLAIFATSLAGLAFVRRRRPGR